MLLPHLVGQQISSAQTRKGKILQSSFTDLRTSGGQRHILAA